MSVFTNPGEAPNSETGVERPDPDAVKQADAAKAAEESREETTTQPDGFRNDPDDATNPNEAIERFRRKLRP